MNTTVINVKTTPETKKEAQKLAKELGLSLSSLINILVKHVIRTKTITLNANEEEPSEYMIKMLKESAEDIKAGRVYDFPTLKDENSYLDKIIKKKKRAK